MIFLVKIGDDDCPVCQQLAEHDKQFSEARGLPLVTMTPGECAQSPGALRTHVVKTFVDENGLIDVPIYLVMDGGEVTASALCENLPDLTAFLEKWEASVKSELFG